MIANLEFDLDKPDDCKAHKIAVYSQEMAFFIWNLKHNTIRKGIKELNYTEFIHLIQEEIKDLPFEIDNLIE